MKGGRSRKLGDCSKPQTEAEAALGRKGASGHLVDKNRWDSGVWQLMTWGRGSHEKQSEVGMTSYIWPSRRLDAVNRNRSSGITEKCDWE